MNVVVTAGNTIVPIDRVRGITNIFTGKTGARIAVAAHAAGHAVTLVTSYPEAIPEAATLPVVEHYQTFDELEHALGEQVRGGRHDAIVHAAAVSDYLPAGVYRGPDRELIEPGVGKIKSDEAELWLKLTRAPKLIDRMRTDWGFAGVLVKFKLEVDVDDVALLTIAEASRQQSRADLMVANTLEEADAWAFLGPLGGHYERVSRAELPAKLLAAIVEAQRG
jgi:phosphopantothenoylcysteine synthetase/decarboxylase